MRPIERIDRICNKLKELWKMYQDERFGQFIVNHIFNEGKDPFNIEDERQGWMTIDYTTWEDKLDKEIENYKLWIRVRNETSYLKDYDKWFRTFLRNCKTKKKSPNWRDYISKLKVKLDKKEKEKLNKDPLGWIAKHVGQEIEEVDDE